MDAVHLYLLGSVQPLVRATNAVRRKGNLIDAGLGLRGSAAEDWMGTGISKKIEEVVEGGGKVCVGFPDSRSAGPTT